MLKKKAIEQLLVVKSILSQMDDFEYSLKLEILKNSSIGSHVRHIVEFYECLIMNPSDGLVNYDQRKRNMLLENSVKYAQDFIAEIIDKIEMVESNKRILLAAEYSDEVLTMETSLYRELSYNIEHTVHHLALVRIAISQHFSKIELPDNFGYADSTVKYLKMQNAY